MVRPFVVLLALLGLAAFARAQGETPAQRERREIIEALDDFLTAKRLCRLAITSSTVTADVCVHRDGEMQRAQARFLDRATSDSKYVTIRIRAKAESLVALQDE